MAIITRAYCINEQCKDYGTRYSNNIRTRGFFGKNKDRQLLCCTTCGKRFSQAQLTPFFGLRLEQKKIHQIILLSAKGESIRSIGRKLKVDKDAVNRVVLKTEQHCEAVLLDLLYSLKIDNSRLEVVFSFLKHRRTFEKYLMTK